MVAPPSLRDDGTGWKWLTTCDDFQPAELPDAVLAMLLETQTRDKKITGPIPYGERNDTLYLLGRKFLHKGIDAEDIEDALIEVNATRCVPPLPEAEVRTIAAHVATQEHRADFRPPDAAAAEVRAYAQKLRRRANTWRWPGRSSTAYRMVLEAHIILMERSGRFTYGASVREVAELSGRSEPVVVRAQRFLRAENWLTLQKGAPRGFREAAVWQAHLPKASRLTAESLFRQHGFGARLTVPLGPSTPLPGARRKQHGSEHYPFPSTALIVPIRAVAGVHSQTESVPIQGVRVVMLDLSEGWTDRLGDRECSDPGGHDLWCHRWKGAKGLGKAYEKAWGCLHPVVALPVRDMAKRFGVSAESIRHALATLGAHGLAVKTKDGWRRGDADLDVVATRLGVAGRGEAIRAEHRRQRERFDEGQARGWRLAGGIKAATVNDSPEPEERKA